jgi:hypothetical protein
MAPKKGKKISLNEFLGDNTLGSWADEMDALPTAPAAKVDDHQLRGHDRYPKREDTIRVGPPREDLPLPTRPPYTAFIGNLAFDLTELDLENFFLVLKPKSVKIIRDREDKPKGFGYVEFDDLDGLKEALAKSGSSLSGRTIRVSVAEPAKERSHPNAADEMIKFEGPWRREGPLPDIPEQEHSRRRFEGLSQDRSAISDASTDWRSNKPRTADEALPPTRKGSSFSTPPLHSSSADKEEVWVIGSKFKPSDDIRPVASRPRHDPRDGGGGEPDWRNTTKSRAAGRSDGSSSTPPTPQMSRRKLELLPRSGNVSSSPSPMSSPKMSPTLASTIARPNPFGNAKPVDVSQRDKEVGQRLERERGAVKERLSMSRTSSRGASERTVQNSANATALPNDTSNQKVPLSGPATAPNVRPTLSFANVAANKGTGASETQESVVDAAI